MTCKDIEGKLPAYQEGVLSSEEEDLVNAHIAACVRCSTALSDLRKTVSLLKDLPELEPPPWFTQKIMARVREEAHQKDGLLKKLFFPFYIKIPIEALGALCVIALGLYVYRASGPEMKTYQAPPEAVTVAPSKGMPSTAMENRAKTGGLPKTEPSREEPAVQDTAPQSSTRSERPRGTAGPATSAPSRATTEEKDALATAGAASKEEPERKAFQITPHSEKAVIQKPISMSLTLTVENVASASREVEIMLGESGVVIERKVVRVGAETLSLFYPAQKLHWLFNRLRTIGEVRDYHPPSGVREGNVQLTIRIEPQ
jgi:hypothetical protein